MLTSLGLLLFIPKVVGVADYGYWQLYMFYLAYTGYLSFGVNEGAFIRYSGEVYANLNKTLLAGQYHLLISINAILGLMSLGLIFLGPMDQGRLLVFVAVVISTLLVTPRYFLCNVLQATHRFRENTMSVVIEKLSLIVLLLVFISLDQVTLNSFLLADILSKILGTIYLFYKMSDSIFVRPRMVVTIWQEFKTNLILGLKIVISNVSSLLLVGIPRFFIEKNWGVVAFSKASLIVSFANLIITMVNAIGFVTLPSLTKVDASVLKKYYQSFSLLVSLLLGLVLVAYYPLLFFISKWLPAYIDSLSYMLVVFPVILFESKMALVYTTYLKIFRKENFLMQINLLSVVLTILANLYLLKFDNSLWLFAVLPLIYGLRGLIVEAYLYKMVGHPFSYHLGLDTGLIMIFISANYMLDHLPALFLYLTFLILNLYTIRKSILFKFHQGQLLLQ